MDAFSKSGQYKIIQYLDREENYQSFLAVDIDTAARREVLINRYSGPAARSMAQLIVETAAAGGEDFVEYYSELGALCMVFVWKPGVPLEQLPRQDAPEGEEALALVRALMHEALLQLRLPQLVRNESLHAKNLYVDKKNRRVCLQRRISPGGEATLSLEQALLHAHARALYPPHFFACTAYVDFLDTLAEVAYPNISALYSAWLTCAAAVEQAFLEEHKKGALSRLFPALGYRLKRGFRAWRKQRRQKPPAALQDEALPQEQESGLSL